MSLRMNLYGSSLSSFVAVLGSNDATVLEKAMARLSELLSKEPELSKSKAWLRTLIERGCPLQEDREPPSEPDDGGLMTVQIETEVHMCAVYSLVRAIARPDDLDLSGESDSWAHPAVGSLYNELSACGFTGSKECPTKYHSWMMNLSNGTPLFGDDFWTQWSFYTWIKNVELAEMLPVFRTAAQFERPLPEGYSEEAAKKMLTRLSKGGQHFIGDLINWFSQIQQAGQDAFIYWA